MIGDQCMFSLYLATLLSGLAVRSKGPERRTKYRLYKNEKVTVESIGTIERVPLISRQLQPQFLEGRIYNN